MAGLGGQHMAPGDVVDVHDVQRRVDEGGNAAVQELDDRAAGRRWRGVALADGERGMHEHDGKAARAGAQHFVLGEVLRPLVVAEEVLEVHERLLGGGSAVLGDAERRDRARVHEPADLRSRRGAQDVHRAADVHVVEQVRVGGPEAIDRSQVKDRRDPVDRLVDRGGVPDVADDPLDGQAGEVVVVPSGLDEGTDAGTPIQQGADHRGADESRRARDEHGTEVGGGDGHPDSLPLSGELKSGTNGRADASADPTRHDLSMGVGRVH